ncbi:hypothetical protein ACOSQ2_007666 [Xanthoceras sorbifolium]
MCYSHNLMVQYKEGRVEEWKPNEWIADYRELVGEVDAEEVTQVVLGFML